jgi:peptidoglycan/LPS O-acetylase OafA/YrhL
MDRSDPATQGIAQPGPARVPAHRSAKYPFIDALRGYAVLLVITAHAGGMFSLLPYPAKRLTNFGVHGVQLFFLASCLTLLLSWRGDQALNRASLVGFWGRRFFRIMPLYLVGGAGYFLLEPPAHGFNAGQALACFTFVNIWSPATVPTVPGVWSVVPGGWSVAVEFTFYAMFPLMAWFVTSWQRAWVFTAAAAIIGSVADAWSMPGFVHQFGSTATDHFLYFWVPNQLAVFGLGAVVYTLLYPPRPGPIQAIMPALGRHPLLGVAVCAAACVLVTRLGLPERLGTSRFLVPPEFLAASLILMAFIVILAAAPRSVFVNRAICALGRVSFSAYIVHFAVLHELCRAMPGVFNTLATGWGAILAFCLLWLVTLPLVYGLSWLSWRGIEQPMIGVGRRILALPRKTSGAISFLAAR